MVSAERELAAARAQGAFLFEKVGAWGSWVLPGVILEQNQDVKAFIIACLIGIPLGAVTMLLNNRANSNAERRQYLENPSIAGIPMFDAVDTGKDGKKTITQGLFRSRRSKFFTPPSLKRLN